MEGTNTKAQYWVTLAGKSINYVVNLKNTIKFCKHIVDLELYLSLSKDMEYYIVTIASIILDNKHIYKLMIV